MECWVDEVVWIEVCWFHFQDQRQGGTLILIMIAPVGFPGNSPRKTIDSENATTDEYNAE